MAYLFVALALLAAGPRARGPSPLDHTEPEEVRAAATAYLDTLRRTCEGPVASERALCAQKFRLDPTGDLARATIGEPWAAFVLTYDDLRETEFQDLMKAARFNYYACPIVVDGAFKGIVRVCARPDGEGTTFVACGSRGPTRVAEVNTYNLTLAPEADSLYVICVLTVQNNARYILVEQDREYFAIAASDRAAEIIQANVRHVSRMTMFPLAEVLYKVAIHAKHVDHRPGSKRRE